MRHDSPFVLDLASYGTYAVIRAEGELDIAAVPQLRERVDRAARRAPRVVVDLRDVTFMDTYVLRTLIARSQAATRSTNWSLHCVAGAGIQRLLDLADARGKLRWIASEQLAD